MQVNYTSNLQLFFTTKNLVIENLTSLTKILVIDVFYPKFRTIRQRKVIFNRSP
jgi:hypothetical protein